jgi:uncharacterized membrane protein
MSRYIIVGMVRLAPIYIYCKVVKNVLECSNGYIGNVIDFIMLDSIESGR